MESSKVFVTIALIIGSIVFVKNIKIIEGDPNGNVGPAFVA